MAEQSLMLSCKMLNIAGVHPKGNVAKSLVIFNNVILIFVISLSTVNYVLRPEIQHWESLNILYFYVFGKYQYLFFRRHTLRQVLRYVKYFWDINFQDSRNTILLRYTQWQKYYVMYLGVLAIQLFVMGIATSQTVFDCYIPKGVPPTLIFILETYTLFFAILIHGGWNLLFCLLIVLGVPQVRALNKKIEDLNLNQIKDSNDVTVCLNTIKGYVFYHNLLLRYVQDLNKVFSLPVTVILGFNILTMCVTMYNTSTSESLIFKFHSILVSVILVFEFFVLCALPAQFLMDEFAAIGDTIYCQCMWYLPNIIPARKYLLMILVRSQYAARLTAEGFIDINYGATVFMLKTAYSFYTFLQTLT